VDRRAGTAALSRRRPAPTHIPNLVNLIEAQR
jgi:hypothetical protein